MIKKAPPPISTGDPDSFAYRTIYLRKPLIINQVIENNTLTDTEIRNLINFKNDIRRGVITDPFTSGNPQGDCPETSPLLDRGEINTWKTEIKKYSGKSWFEIPWYFAEAYFYLRLLITYGYYSPKSHNYMKDPFEPLKKKELHAETGVIDILKGILDIVGDMENSNEHSSGKTNRGEILKTLILFSLWGNRIDLSNYHIAQKSKGDTLIPQSNNIIIDNSEELLQKFMNADRIDFILDNTGQELVCDLALIRYLFNLNRDKRYFQIVLHVKKAPFFISDTMKKDIDTVLRAFAEPTQERIRNFGEFFSELLDSGKLKIMEHYFWNGPLHFPDMPDDIHRSLKLSGLTVIKGDANYRRLLSDRKWKVWESMKEITDYFPASFAVLRTMKSEIAVDIKREQAKSLFNEDRDWMVNGKRGIIQLIEK